MEPYVYMKQDPAVQWIMINYRLALEAVWSCHRKSLLQVEAGVMLMEQEGKPPTTDQNLPGRLVIRKAMLFLELRQDLLGTCSLIITHNSKHIRQILNASWNWMNRQLKCTKGLNLMKECIIVDTQLWHIMCLYRSFEGRLFSLVRKTELCGFLWSILVNSGWIWGL